MVTDSVANFQGAFSDRLCTRANRIRSWLCVGLDPDPDRLPADIEHNAAGVASFCRQIIEATQDAALCYKLNFAFFEALGPDGWAALQEVRGSIPAGVPVIADAKRGDIPSTMLHYARAIFDRLSFDAVTLNPFLGWESLEPFLERPGRAVFVLARTSNPGAGHFQDLPLSGVPLYLRIAREASSMNRSTEIGVVAGATNPESLREIRAVSESLLILVPGVGAQGASASDAFHCASNAEGQNALVTMSRSILYASSGRDFQAASASAAREAARQVWRGSSA